jgi:hypothetical protein
MQRRPNDVKTILYSLSTVRLHHKCPTTVRRYFSWLVETERELDGEKVRDNRQQTKSHEEPDLIDELVRLLVSENFTFIDNWNDEQITPSTYRLYGRRVPAKEAARQFIERVRRSFEPNQLREKKAEDVQKHRRIHREWAPASESTSGTLEQILKEPELLLFFRGAI